MDRGHDSCVFMRWMVKRGGRNEDVSRSGFTENFEGVTFIEDGDGQV